MKPTRGKEKRSVEIVDIIRDVVAQTSRECGPLTFSWPELGKPKVLPCPNIHYVFGNSRYVKERLDELSKSPSGTDMKFPMIALFTNIKEEHDSPDYYAKVRINLIIAYSSMKKWNNEAREEYAFKNILRPIYRAFLEALRHDGRLDFGYKGHIPHTSYENYTYGKYGAVDSAGEEVSEAIDAININNLQLTIKNQTCR